MPHSDTEKLMLYQSGHLRGDAAAEVEDRLRSDEPDLAAELGLTRPPAGGETIPIPPRRRLPPAGGETIPIPPWQHPFTRRTAIGIAGGTALVALLLDRHKLAAKTQVAIERARVAEEEKEAARRELGYYRAITLDEIFRGHGGPVNAVAFSPDGTLLASASFDRTVKLWDAAGHGRELWTSPEHGAAVRGVAFSPDGRLLASAGHDKLIRIWKVDTHEEVHELRGHTLQIWSVAFSPDGKLLASAGGARAVSAPGEAKVWDVAQGRELFDLEGHSRRVWSVAFSPDGRRLATAGEERTVKIWDVADAIQKNRIGPPRILGHTELSILCVAFSPDPGGRWLASGGGDILTKNGEAEVKVWDTTSDRSTSLGGHTGRVYSVAFSHDGRLLASAGSDTSVKIWDMPDGSEVLTLRGHEAQVRSVTFAPKGWRLASGSEDRTVRVWDMVPSVTNPEKPVGRGEHHGPVWCVAPSRDGRRLASGDEGGTIRVWDVVDRPEALRSAFDLTGHRGRVWSVAFSPDGRHLASASEDHTVKVWNLSTRKAYTIEGLAGWVRTVAFSPDGRHLASVGVEERPDRPDSIPQYKVRIWDTAQEAEGLRVGGFHDFPGHDWVVTSVAFSPDSRYLASASWDQSIQVWDVDTHRGIFTLGGRTDLDRGHVGRISGVAFSPDGKLLASAGDDRVVWIWDMATRKEMYPLRGHAAGINGVAFSPDGKFLASADDDGAVKIWHVMTGGEFRTLRASTAPVLSVAFCSRGGRLALTSAGADRNVWLWDLGVPAEAAAVR